MSNKIKEIHVYLTGRMGNQLFQYSFAKKLQSQYGGKIYMNIYDLEHRSEKLKHVPCKFKYDLENFKLNEDIEIEDEKPFWLANLDNIFNKLFRKFLPKLFFKLMSKRGYLIWLKRGYVKIPDLKKEIIHIFGWWQDYRYFYEVEKTLQNTIIPTTNKSTNNAKIYELSKINSTVCLSIRGGNYLVPKIKKRLFVCNILLIL